VLWGGGLLLDLIFIMLGDERCRFGPCDTSSRKSEPSAARMARRTRLGQAATLVRFIVSHRLPPPPLFILFCHGMEFVDVSMASAGTCPVTGLALVDPHARYVAGRGGEFEHGVVGDFVCSLCDGLNEAH